MQELHSLPVLHPSRFGTQASEWTIHAKDGHEQSIAMQRLEMLAMWTAEESSLGLPRELAFSKERPLA